VSVLSFMARLIHWVAPSLSCGGAGVQGLARPAVLG
jgi:hypothetical protein